MNCEIQKEIDGRRERKRDKEISFALKTSVKNV